MFVLTAVLQEWTTTSNWRNVPSVILFDIAEISVVKSIAGSMRNEEECKRQKASLHDRKLFSQPDQTHLGECLICFLPLPIDPEKYTFHNAAATILFVMAVFMPTTLVAETKVVHSVESRGPIKDRPKRDW